MRSVESATGEALSTSSGRDLLDRPRSLAWSVAAWTLATLLFVSLVALLGGPSQSDSGQSIYTAMMMAHGQWSCAYPPLASSHLNGSPLAFASPVYPLVSAAAAWLLNLGAGTPFPSFTQLGSHCAHAIGPVSAWIETTNTLRPLTDVGLVSWIALSGGVVAIVRAARRQRDGWEALTLIVVACSAPLLSCLEWSFHPEDIMTMGVILFAVASAVNEKWWLVGILMGVALLTHLFALLALVPLAMLIPRRHRSVVAAGFVGVIAVVVTPLAAATSGAVLHSVFFGTSKEGGAHFGGAGGTVVFAAGLHGVTLFLVSRVAPVMVAALVTLAAMKKWGARVREPAILMSLVATCLTVRLALDVNIFGYYFMAATVSLLVIDALQGRIRGESIAVISLISLAYSPVTQYFRWRGHVDGPAVREVLPYLISIPVVVTIVAGLVLHRVRWHWILWQIVVAMAFFRFPMHPRGDTGAFPSWAWQILLVPPLLVMVSRPLRGATTRGAHEVGSARATNQTIPSSGERVVHELRVRVKQSRVSGIRRSKN